MSTIETPPGALRIRDDDRVEGVTSGPFESLAHVPASVSDS